MMQRMSELVTINDRRTELYSIFELILMELFMRNMHCKLNEWASFSSYNRPVSVEIENQYKIIKHIKVVFLPRPTHIAFFHNFCGWTPEWGAPSTFVTSKWWHLIIGIISDIILHRMWYSKLGRYINLAEIICRQFCFTQFHLVAYCPWRQFINEQRFYEVIFIVNICIATISLIWRIDKITYVSYSVDGQLKETNLYDKPYF